MKNILLFVIAILLAGVLFYKNSTTSTDYSYSPLGSISKLSDAKSRSLSAENFNGEVGGGAKAKTGKYTKNYNNANDAAIEFGEGWKVNPFIIINAGETFTIADIKGSGAISHIWMTPTADWTKTIIRIYWDDEKNPSVECPIGDFFCNSFNRYAQLSSLPICVNPGSAFNCYWKMPFRKSAKITIENRNKTGMRLYYQVDYSLHKVDNSEAYFHAQFRESNPTKNALHTIVDGIKGRGQYVGTYIAQFVKNNTWWGEGEVKFYMDNDKKYPTICGTGLEDYICGSYNFEVGTWGKDRHYHAFSTPYSGLHFVRWPTKVNAPGNAFGMYRWHITDPIRFEKNLRVDVQDLGWNRALFAKNKWQYLKQDSRIRTVAFWYQTEPHAKFPELKITDVNLKD